MGTWASYKALGRLADLIWSGQNPFCGEKRIGCFHFTGLFPQATDCFPLLPLARLKMNQSTSRHGRPIKEKRE